MFKIVFSLLFPFIACAQWSNDSNNNLVISDRSDEQVQAKIVATNDGGSYISWYDNADGGYDIYLQKLDVNGNEQWAHNGIIIADRGFSSTQDYGLAIDSTGNALLTFRDDRGGTEKITANKISDTGVLLWGESGIQVSGVTGFLAAPKIAGTTDGNVVVAWTKDSEVVIQKLDSDGLPLWGNGITQSSKTGSLIASDLKASDNGNAIISMVHATSFSAPKHIWVQKFSSLDGTQLWGENPLAIFDAGSLQFANFPSFIIDNIGGAIFTWYTSSPSLDCRVQRIDLSGIEYFAHNGIVTSTNASQLRVNPTSSFKSSTQEIYTFWNEISSNQSQSGIYGQKFNSSGVRQWTDSGKEIKSLSTNQHSFIQSSIIAGMPMIAWINSMSFNNDIIEATQVNSNGDFNWKPAIVEIGSNTNTDSRLSSAVNSFNFGMYAWTEGDDLKAQNLLIDGTLGMQPDVIFANDFEL